MSVAIFVVIAADVAEVAGVGDPFAGVVELAVGKERVALGEGVTDRDFARLCL